MTTAEKIAERFGNDGQRWTDDDGYNIERVCRNEAQYEERKDNMMRWTFADDSVIVTTDGGWDIGYRDCWCWRGAGHMNGCQGA